MPRFLLDQREVITCGHFKDQCYFDYWGKYHYAVDYVAEYVPVYAPTDLTITNEYWGSEGGHWLEYTAKDGARFRLAHLKEYKHSIGPAKEGTPIAISGNSGSRRNAAGQIVQYAPHLHVECRINNTLYDPELYFDKLLHAMSYNDKIVRNQDTGEFGLVVRNKKFIIPPEPGTMALLTFLQREDKQTLSSEIINITKEIWDSIPTSPNLNF